MARKRFTVVEEESVVLDPMDFRRAVSSAANAAKTMTAALEHTQQQERGRLKGAADECIAALAALAFGQIRRVVR